MNTPLCLSETFMVAPQITKEQVQQVALLGVKTIINNRPDNEENNQPMSCDIEQAALDLGLDYFYLPIAGRNINKLQISLFQEITGNAASPILSFCRTGTRSSALWAMASQDEHIFNARLERAKEVGYDLTWVNKLDTGRDI